jgi:hypothetical protein
MLFDNGSIVPAPGANAWTTAIARFIFARPIAPAVLKGPQG